MPVNPSYSGDGDWEDHCSRPAWVKRPISTNNPGMVVRACGPNYKGGVGRKIEFESGPRQKCKTLYKK
jgi:hypothetical protein